MNALNVYGLYDTRDPERIRYVGKTTGTLRVRLSNHWTYSRKEGKLTRVQGWLKSRSTTPELVGMRVLRTASSEEELNRVEIETIAEYRARGEADLNHTDGGEGMRGVVRTPESREALSRKYRKTGGPNATLNWQQVREIRTNRMLGYEEAASVAERYGVGRTVIDRILRNQMWIDSAFEPSQVKPRPAGTSKLAKLTLEQVNGIRTRRAKEWVSSRALAEAHGVTESAIQHILSNLTYKDPNYCPEGLAVRGRTEYDARRKGRPHLTREQVQEIRSRGEAGASHLELSLEYGVTPGQIRNIRTRKSWSTVK